ncbi:MAG: S8 family serine peptidase [Acetobacteraceae bacterium]|nr:S8 family serine peptidase [Acetobacteraceae bacterium]
MSRILRYRALAAFTAAMLLAGLSVVTGGPAAEGGSDDRPSPSSGPALIYYGETVDGASLQERLNIPVTEDYGSFAMADISSLDRDRLELGGIVVQAIENISRICLESGEFDTSDGEPPLPPHLTNPDGIDGWYLVQFKGPIKDEWRAQLEATGEVVGYCPNFALLAYLDAAGRAAVAAWPFVHWVGPYHPGYRLAPGLKDGTLFMTFFPGRGGPETLAKLEAMGLKVLSADGDEAIVEGTVASIEQAVTLDEVSFVEQYGAPELLNVARDVINADVAHGNGINGRPSSQIVAVTDTGMWLPHECVSEPGKVVSFIDIAGDGFLSQGDGDGHGTHVGCSAWGDAPYGGAYLTYNGHDGQAFGSRAVPVKVFTNAGIWAGGANYYVIWDLANDRGARINNNSWGIYTGGAYTASDRDADLVAWDHRDYVLVMAAGNGGTGSPNTTASPACAKNVIAVGATETPAPENVAYFSSRGPTDDSRIKPDVMAPGAPVCSAQRGDPDGYVYMSGTSMAAPQVTGSAALVREYFMRGYYPTGQAVPANAFTPRAALVKAVLINGAKEMTGLRADWNNEGRWPNSAQGWGRIDLDRSLYFAGDARRVIVWDNPANLTTGLSWVGRFHVSDGSQEAKITLAWTDAPALPGAAVTLVNDLDLWVITPNGAVFRGNNFTGLNPGYSITGGNFNRRDTVEGVHLVPNRSLPGNLPVGMYTVIVTAANVPQPVSNFALVVTGGVAQEPPAPVERVAVMGDYMGTIKNLLEGWGYTVRNYGSGDYAAVVANLTAHDVVILNRVDNTSGFDSLYDAANLQQKGLIFCGSWAVSSHGMGVLAARRSDPSMTTANWGQGPVKTTVLAAHPVFTGYNAGQQLTLISGGDNDYQTYNGYSGTDLGRNDMASGYPYMIGVKDRQQTGGARHVVLGSLGACYYTNPRHWTPDGQQVMVNAVEWAAGGQSPPPGRARVALMGDYNDQIKQYLSGVGYRVTSFGSGDYTGVINNLANFDVVLLHKVDNASGFDSLLSQAETSGRGLVFMSSYPVASHGMGVLSARRLDPSAVAQSWLQGTVRLSVAQAHPVLAGYPVGSTVTIINGGENDYQTYSGYTGTTIGNSLMPGGYPGMVGVRNRSVPTGSRHVVLGSFGACPWTQLAAWTPNGFQILKNAIEWAKYGAP